MVSPNVVTATFNLLDATAGARTVTITSPTGATITLPDAFTVQEGGASTLQIQKVGTPAVLGHNETFYITVTNTGATDAGATPIIEAIEPWFTFVTAAPVPTTVTASSAVFPPGASSKGYDSTLEWDLPSVPSGQSILLTYTVFVNSALPVSGTVAGPACIDIVRNTCYSNLAQCQNELLAPPFAFACFYGRETPPYNACFLEVIRCYAQFFACAAIGEDACAIFYSGIRGSVDPNDLSSSGFGPQGWIPGNIPVQYVLSFENLAAATKNATTVTITDVFDSTVLDPSSLSIGPITFGASEFTPPAVPLATDPISADIDLRPAQSLIVRLTAELDSANGQLTVNFASIDPATGLPPTDPLVGFLPPGVGGTVSFSIMPRSSLATGATILDGGTVVFDSNPPINTPNALNTIDITPPKSRVTTLPATQSCSNFQVNWSGSDAGSGVGAYYVFVSDTGGPFQVWLSNTPATNGIYQGTVGHTYSFFSIARDNAGNVEGSKTAGEASTNIGSNSSCGPPGLSVTVASSVVIGSNAIVVLQFMNSSASSATAVTINQIAAHTLAGAVQYPLNAPMVPIAVGPLAVGGSQTVTVTLTVPASVAPFSLIESGTLTDASGTGFSYSLSQAIVGLGVGCDINGDGETTVTDAQGAIDEGLGLVVASTDLNHDGSVNVVDIQSAINAAAGLGCNIQ